VAGTDAAPYEEVTVKDPDNGKEFAPSEHVDAESDATESSGGGKQYAPDVKDPRHDERATRTEGSAKEFAPGVQDPEEVDEEVAGRKGSGKQFAPGRHEL
jgi:hypothetical protein